MKTENCTLTGLQAICGRPYQSCYMIQFHFAFTMVVSVEKRSNCLNLTQSSDSTLFHTAHQKKTNKYYWHRTVHMYIIITGITSCFVSLVVVSIQTVIYKLQFAFFGMACSNETDLCLFSSRSVLMIWASYKIFRFSWT